MAQRQFRNLCAALHANGGASCACARGRVGEAVSRECAVLDDDLGGAIDIDEYRPTKIVIAEVVDECGVGNLPVSLWTRDDRARTLEDRHVVAEIAVADRDFERHVRNDWTPVGSIAEMTDHDFAG